MEKRVDAKLCKRIVALGLMMLVIVWLIGSLWPEGGVDAAEEEVSETPVISTELGNGPEEITSVADFGWTAMKKWGTPALNPGSIVDNTVRFSNFSSSNYYTTASTGAWWAWNTGWNGSGSETDDSIIISMEHDWKLKAQVYIAATTAYKEHFAGFFIRINDALNGRVVSNIQTTCYQKVISPGHINMYNGWKNLELTYNSTTKKVNCKIAGIQLFDQTITNCKKAVIKAAGVRGTLSTSTIPTDYPVSQLTFQSFEYTDYHIKADNTITDYAGRKITGAVGNGQFIGVHPKIYNNIPLNTQRYSGTVSLDSQSAASNITPLDRQDGSNISSNPLAFTHTADPFQDVAFDAKIDTGGASYTPGQKFRLPLVINDDYFGDSNNFTGNTGPAATWDKLQYDEGEGEGPKDQLPFKLKVVRDTRRELVHDQTQSNTPTSASAADYTHTIAGKAVKPNAHGWYNNNVTINFQTDPDEYNELNFSSATGDTKITSANIAYTTESGGSFTVRGKDEDGNPTATEETSDHGNTYSVFGRKGTAEETEDLSAVTTETFRIDKTPPTLKIADRTELSNPRKLEAADTLSGVDYIKWKGPKDTEFTEDHIIAIETDPAATLGTKKPVAQSLPKLTDLGNYTFVAVDLAGNESDPLTVTNSRPELSAQDVKVSFKDTIKNFNLLTAHKAGSEDKEDGKLIADRLDWEVRKKGTDTVVEKGTGTEALSDFLSVGSYEVTFFLNDTGTDADGNKPDPERVTVKLTISPEGPPDITLAENPNAGTVDGTTSTRPDGSRHYMVEDEKTIIVDTSDPYSGGSLTDQEVQKEIEDHFNFKSQLPFPANDLDIDLKIYDDKGNDITGTPVNTLKNGSYTAVYVATDKSGCTTTLQLTYNIKENVVVTFRPGKGDYKDGSEFRQVEIKVNKAPEKKDLPDGIDTNVLIPPADTCFIGWGTSQSAKTTVDPTAIKLNKDTTYYAIYGPDINNNNIPDSKEAIFIFKSDDPEHAAFKYADKTMVGLLVPEGTAITLPTEKIPELLFERIEDRSYRLKGWKTDATDDKILTTEELTALGRNAGSKLTVTAIIEEYEIKKEDKILVTFFSSEPKSSPLEGGEGQTVELDAPKPDEPVTIPKAILPKVSLSSGSKLEGWKTSDTGDIILTDDQVASQQLYGGREITCVAYVKPEVKTPEKVPTPGKDNVTEKEVTKKVIIEKEKTKKVPAAKQEKEKPSNNVTFIFYTSRTESGIIQTGDGTEVTLPAGDSGKASLVKKLIPELQIQDGSSFIGWRTSFTGSRLLTDKELCALSIPAGTTVKCTAYFKYKERQLKTEGTTTTVTKDGEALTSFGDEQVPLGSKPGGWGDRMRNNPSCIVHWLMLVWLVLSGLTILFRLHNRKRSDEFLYPDENHPMTGFRTEEDYRSLAASQRTDIRDYLFLACDMAIGITLFIIGTCMFELPLLAAGALLACYDLIRLKILDKKEKKAMEEAVERLESK